MKLLFPVLDNIHGFRDPWQCRVACLA